MSSNGTAPRVGYGGARERSATGAISRTPREEKLFVGKLGTHRFQRATSEEARAPVHPPA